MSSLPELDEHEQHATEFLDKIGLILIEALGLSDKANPQIFYKVASLRGELRRLLIENTDRAKREAFKNARREFDEAVKRILS